MGGFTFNRDCLESASWIQHPFELTRRKIPKNESAFASPKFIHAPGFPRIKHKSSPAPAMTSAWLQTTAERIYIETLNRWGDSTKSLFRPPNLWPAFFKAISMIPRYLVESDFRLQVSCVVHNDQQECLKREIMNHERMFFEKK
jgi:hypothetical protein